MTLQEVIDNLRSLVKESPRTTNEDTRIGLYIELKDYSHHLTTTGHDMAQMTHDLLTKNDLESVDLATDDIPIVIISFDEKAIEKYASLSDLPLIQLAAYKDSLHTYDWHKISEIAHGVGPNSQWVFHPFHLLNSKTE